MTTPTDLGDISGSSIDDIAASAGATVSVALKAYLWGYPLVLMHRTKRVFTSPDQPHSSALNTLHHRARPASAEDREIVKPNNDTVYSLGWLDLSRGPVVLEVPEVGERYYSIALLDAYTNNWAYVGSRTTGRGAGRFVITGPSSREDGQDSRLDSPTDTVWLIGRTLVDGPEDLVAVSALISQYRLTPLTDDTSPPAGGEGPVESPHTIGDAGIGFFDELCQALELDPPPSSEKPLLDGFAELGIAAGRRPSAEVTDPVPRLAMASAARLGDDLLGVQRNRDRGWHYGLDLGDYGTNYLLRAQIAKHGLGALTADEAIYATTELDQAGDHLTGAHRYRLCFDADESPPVDAFWSLTMYDRDGFLVDNAAGRYSIGDRTPGLIHGPGGSLELTIAHDEPSDPAERANWLPAPEAGFQLNLRFYEPRAALLSGSYEIPPVRRL